ncbi:tRNA pseudouridine(38-40) synthase TruA [Novipirellula artificiosorum]|uniref:tRNA pseudouridine synthase A n=1 Tax=Novipirellula artificiosorum TaxID=2528016 RepID=A0A5C6E016_9BACT|nr:tRNA pseudouridine(38-40) synthase TruA [Novipirellula artificiosorum]TWU42200.1 tRNA pseudouridine synthase A [Novipirellula artificiosorum]
MRTFKITVAYDGVDFAGWQIQPRRTTIQGMLERALVKLTGQRVAVTGSGRTDSGVHALAQVASFRTPNWRATAADLANAMNVHLPPTIVVLECVDAPDDFHAIADAVGKRYRYQLQIGGTRSVFDYRYCWQIHGDIHLDAIAAACESFVGQHDFSSFQGSRSPRKTTVRTVRACDLLRESTSLHHGERIVIEIEADGFLYNMVRNIVGTLIEVGKGKHDPSWIADVLAARDRDAAGPTAPPQGLFLQRVDYRPFA